MEDLSEDERNELALLEKRERLAHLRRERVHDQIRHEVAAWDFGQPEGLHPRDLMAWQIQRAWRQDKEGRLVRGKDREGREFVRCPTHATKHKPGSVPSVACRLGIGLRTLWSTINRLHFVWPNEEDGPPKT